MEPFGAMVNFELEKPDIQWQIFSKKIINNSVHFRN